MSRPRVTGIIPLHNHAQWIAQCVDSMAYNTFTPERIVIVDDGSTDNGFDLILAELSRVEDIPTPEIQPIAKRGFWHNGVEVILMRYEMARGPAFARNAAMQPFIEDTDLFFFLDSDDYYHKEKIEISILAWEKAPEAIGAVYTDYHTHNPKGIILQQYCEPYSRKELEKDCLIGMNSLVSALAIKTCGGFNESFRVCEDYEFWLRITSRFLAVHIPVSLMTRRTGNHSSSVVVSQEMWRECYKETKRLHGIELPKGME